MPTDPLEHAEALQAIVKRNEELEEYALYSRRRNTIVNIVIGILAASLIAVIIIGTILLRNDDRASRSLDRQGQIATYLVGLSEQVQCSNLVEYRSLLARQAFFVAIIHVFAASAADPNDNTPLNVEELNQTLQQLEKSNAEARLVAIGQRCKAPKVPEFITEQKGEK